MARPLTDKRKAEVLAYWVANPEDSFGSISRRFDTSIQSVSRIITPTKNKTRDVTIHELESRLEDFVYTSVDLAEHHAAIFKRDIALLEARLRGEIDAKERSAIIKERNDLIYRTGSNQIALMQTLKGVGVGSSLFGGGSKDSPHGNLYQYFITVDGASAKNVDEGFTEALRLRERQDAFTADAEVEVIDEES